MAKVTSKLQVTVPKVLAEQYGIEPGSDIEWQAAGDTIRVLPPGSVRAVRDATERLALFDHATRRQQKRQSITSKKLKAPGKVGAKAATGTSKDRGWKREELYDRGSTR